MNSAMSVRTAACSNSLMPPTSCNAWRWRAWMHLRMPSTVSKALSPWCVVSVGDPAPLSPATTQEAFSGAGTSFGDASAPADSPSGSWSAHLASRRRLHVSIVKVSMRSKSMFQCSLEGGLRFIDILGPCSRLGRNFSCSYSSMGAVASPRRWGKAT